MSIFTRTALSLLLCLAGPAAAGGFDPLATSALTPERPSPRAAGRAGDVPCATALPATPLTAIDVVDLALCNNPQTREVWANARAQAAQVGVARSAWLPDLDGRLGAGRTYTENGAPRYVDTQSAALTLSWLVFDSGARSANGENARQLLAAAAATQDATVQTLFLSALQAFYTAQATNAAVVSTTEAERAAREGFNAAESRYSVGAATPADRLLAQTALSQATLNRIKAEGEARNALGALANAMGFSAGSAIVVAAPDTLKPDAAFARDVATLIAEAEQRRPDLKAAEAQVRAAEAGVDLAQAQGLPSVTVSAAPVWADVDRVSRDTGVLGLTLNVPLFTGFETTYRVRAAESQVDLRTAQRDRLKNQVALDVWRAYQNLTTATQSLRTTVDLVASAEQSERVALGRYKAGVGNVLDLLSAQSALASARLQRIQAALDWYVSRATLAQSVGTLDYSLLQPPAQGKP
ncbi:MAG: TolC family protein [Betaproteobacteria bacterium]|nr:TolC family protein [Betaproteobacteria bacterium]